MQNENNAPALTNDDRREISMAALTTKTSVMDPTEYQQIKVVANDLVKSGALPESFKNAHQVMMAILAGREMGMGTQEALSDLYFVGGRLQIYGKATPAALRRAGWQIVKFEEDATQCTATIRNAKTGEEITDTFTYEEAELSGFTKDKYGNLKVGWKEGANRKRKLRYGVLSQIIHTYVPEVLGAVTGVGEYSEDYLSTDAKAAAANKQADQAAQKQAVTAALDELMTEDEQGEEIAEAEVITPSQKDDKTEDKQ